MYTTEDNPENCIWISLPKAPSLIQVRNSSDSQSAWFNSFTTSSITMSAIAAKLRPQFSNRGKSTILNEMFILLDSPIEKYNLVQLLIPGRARGTLVTKNQLIKILLRYTQTESVKSGIIRTAIDSIDPGKPTQTATDELINETISILKIYWDECHILKNSNYTRFKNVRDKYNNQLTLENLSTILDTLLDTKISSTGIDTLFSVVQHVFDMLSMIGERSVQLDENSQYTMHLIFSCILNKTIINERVVFGAVCLKPKNLATSIWHSRAHIWDVIYGIEYLKNTDIHLWKKMLDLTNVKKGQSHATLVVSLNVSIPFFPMRCVSLHDNYNMIVDRVSIFKDNIRQEEEGYCIEEKLDGERSLLHIWRDGDKIHVKFYSRKFINQSWYGNYVGDPEGVITKYMKPEWFEGIQDLILDGEMIAYDHNVKKLLGYQDVKACCERNRKSMKEGIDMNDVPIYNKHLIFDILYLNGESFQLTTLRERKDKLDQLFTTPGLSDFKFIEKHKYNIGYNPNDLTIAMQNVMNRNSEGLVVKHWKSLYFVGKHSPHWVKLKPHYLKDFINDLDVIILGKEGSNFICGLYGGEEGDDVYKHWYVSFCVLRFGLDENKMRLINDQTNGHWIKYEKNKSDLEMFDHNVKFGKLKPHYWIHPQNSIVITIKAKSLVVLSDQGEARLVLDTTLRHPYCTEVRTDKQYYECDTIEAYKAKAERQGRKNPFDENEERYGKRKKPRRETKMDIALTNVNKNFVKSFVKKDELFKGFTFCVKTDCMVNGQLLQINEINGILESHGGKIINDPKQGAGTRFLVIADKNTMSVNTLKKDYNIFKFKWCEDCIWTDEIVKLDPSHCLVVDDEIREMSLTNVDRFGCNYTIKYSESELWANCENRVEEEVVASREQCEELHFFYNNKKFLMLGYDETNSFEREIVEMQIEIHGGDIVDDESDADIIVTGSALNDNISRSIPILPSSAVLEKCGYGV